MKDVPAKDFIEAFAKHLKKGNKIKMPEWASIVKTAAYKDLGPYDKDWLYTRAAAVAYQLYMRKKCGVNGLRRHFGTKVRRGTRTNTHRPACGKNIRYCLKQLEAAGLVGLITFLSDDGTTLTMGKSLTRKGTTDMDRIATQLKKESRKQN